MGSLCACATRLSWHRSVPLPPAVREDAVQLPGSRTVKGFPGLLPQAPSPAWLPRTQLPAPAPAGRRSVHALVLGRTEERGSSSGAEVQPGRGLQPQACHSPSCLWGHPKLSSLLQSVSCAGHPDREDTLPAPFHHTHSWGSLGVHCLSHGPGHGEQATKQAT